MQDYGKLCKLLFLDEYSISWSNRVYGTKRLRVVDAGILPFEVTSHTQSLTYAVAQKGADLILADALLG